MVLFIIGLVLLVGNLVFLFYNLKKIANDRTIGQTEMTYSGTSRIKILISVILNGFITILSSFGLSKMNGWSFNGGFTFLLILSSLILGISFAAFIENFYLYYYVTNLKQKNKKIARILTFVFGVIVPLSLFLFSEVIATQDIFPLISGWSFKNGFIKPSEKLDGFGFKFYGLILVSGAILCYFITDHETFKKFGKHGLIDSLFIVAFLAGVIGSRLWYCLVLEYGKYHGDWNKIIFGITDGGLAIQGGALGGALVGIIFVLIFRKYIDVRFLMDVAIPSILLAQALGRWGNFFNQEVYGGIAPSWMVNIMPTIVRKNMLIDGEYRVPLFLIESMINFGGFFFIRYFIGKVCKASLGLGYQSACYLTWYGLVRTIMEPLRQGYVSEPGSKYGYSQSRITAIVMICMGVALFIFMFIFHTYRKQKGLEDSYGNKIKK